MRGVVADRCIVPVIGLQGYSPDVPRLIQGNAAMPRTVRIDRDNVSLGTLMFAGMVQKGSCRPSPKVVEQQATGQAVSGGQEGKGSGPVEASAFDDRMQVILDPDGYDIWLDPGMHDMRTVSDMLKPYEPGRLRCE